MRDRVTGVAIATAVYFAASALIQAPTWETIFRDVCWRPKWPEWKQERPTSYFGTRWKLAMLKFGSAVQVWEILGTVHRKFIWGWSVRKTETVTDIYHRLI